MKKKIIALILTLALVVAMLIPAFAAVAQPDSTNACNHNWVDAGNIYSTGTYAYYNPTYHREVCRVPQICTQCAARRENEVQVGYYSHNSGTYCTVCNHSVPHSIPGEVMSDTDEREHS